PPPNPHQPNPPLPPPLHRNDSTLAPQPLPLRLAPHHPRPSRPRAYLLQRPPHLPPLEWHPRPLVRPTLFRNPNPHRHPRHRRILRPPIPRHHHPPRLRLRPRRRMVALGLSLLAPRAINGIRPLHAIRNLSPKSTSPSRRT